MDTTETTTLRLKVAAAEPEEDTCHKFGNWGFLQTVAEEDRERCYSHPLGRKPSFSKLSAKSLELCTENLGSETGTDIITDGSSIFMCTPPLSPSSIPSGYSTPTSEFGGWKENNNAISARNSHRKEMNSCRRGKDFPPPLTTMSGSSSLQVRRHAEGGRLIIEAVETPFGNSYLQAERSDGRLRLCFVTSSDAAETACSSDGDEEENGGECGGEMAEEEQLEDPRIDFESDVEEFNGEINLDMGMEKFQRPSRCKDGSHGREGLCCNWIPPLWVATS